MIWISYSDVSAYQRCQRHYWHRSVARRVPVRSSTALRLGTVLHKALEAWWRGGGDATEAEEELMRVASDIEEQDACKLVALLMHYSPPADRYTVIGIERKLEMPIKSHGKHMRGVRFRGIADLLLEDKATGAVLVVDHKSTSSEIVGFGPYWQALSINRQHAWYRLASGAQGAAYDVLRKPAIRPSKADDKSSAEQGITQMDAYAHRVMQLIASDPAEWYQWREIAMTDDDLAAAMQDLAHAAEQIRESHKRGRWPCSPGGCVTRYGTCEYLDVCTGRARLDDDALFRDGGDERYATA